MWSAEYSYNISVRHPTGCLAKFIFPAKDGIHYLTSPTSAPLQRGSILEARFAIFGGTAPLHFVSVDRLTSPLVPNCSLYFQHKDDNMRTDGMRWWSKTRADLRMTDEAVLRVALQPANWYTVYGGEGNKDQQHLNWFNGSLANVGRWGITFGGDFPGHGVYETSGTARFKLLSFKCV